MGAVLGLMVIAGCRCPAGAPHFQSTPRNCVDPEECPSTEFFVCSTRRGLCVPSCSTRADCTASVRGEFAFAPCDTGLGCRCDHGVCVPAQCSVDDECAAPLVCRNGGCTAPPASSRVARCEVAIETAIVPQGATFEATVLAVDELGEAVVPTGAQWSIEGAAVREVRGLTVVVSTPRIGNVNVNAAFTSATCTGTVKVVSTADIPSGAVDVLAIDAHTGHPIAGVTVVASGPTWPSAPMTSTGPDGIARLSVGAAASVTVSAYHPAYDFSTLAELALPDAGAPGAAVMLTLRPNRRDLVGGFTGEFTPRQVDFWEADVGMVGLSLPQVVADLSTESLVGPPVDIPGVAMYSLFGGIRTKPVESVPLGSALSSPGMVEGPAIKSTYAALGAAGRCADAGMDRSCGTRAGWAITSRPAWGFRDFDLIRATPDNRDLFAELLLEKLRHGDPFHSTVVRDVSFSLRPPPSLTDGGADLTSTAGLHRLDLAPEQVPLEFSSLVTVPEVPRFGGVPVPSVLLLAGAQVPGRGWVPLGLGAAVTERGTVISQRPWQGWKQIRFRSAPPHHGLEGSPLQIIALARSQRSNSERSGTGTSATVLPLPGNRLVYDEDGGTALELTPFPPFPESAEYNEGRPDAGTLGQRAFRFASDAGISGSVVQVVFTNAQGQRWVVLRDPTHATTPFALPLPPPGFGDRTLWNGSTLPRSKLEVQTLRLEDRGRPLSFEELVRWNATNLDRVGQLTTGYATVEYPQP